MIGPQVDYLDEDEAWAVVNRLGFHVRDAGLLSSALARPRSSAFGEDAYPDLIAKAAAMFESLVQNHPSLDGNKRLAVVLTWTFLLNNDVELEYEEDKAYEFVMQTAAGHLTLRQIDDWLVTHSYPVAGSAGAAESRPTQLLTDATPAGIRLPACGRSRPE